MGKAIFITGTGTDIGKTALSLAVTLWAQGKNLRIAYYKPVQCGTFPFGTPPSPCGDSEWVQALAGKPLTTHVTYSLRMAASPHLAAEKEKLSISLERIAEEMDALASAHDLVIVEGAGGAAVPLNRRGESLALLAGRLSLPCLVASAPGLGTLHHTLTTFAFLQSFQVPVLGFVFSHLNREIPETCADNRLTLEGLTGKPCFGELPYCPELSLGWEDFRRVAATWHRSIETEMEAWWNPNPL